METLHKQNQPHQGDGCHTSVSDAIRKVTLQCNAPRKTQINSVIDELEEMSNVQAPITPDGILNNMLAMFDCLPNH
jgi:hypothetical protein